MPKAIESRVEKAIGERVFPGCVVGVVRASGERQIFPFGNFTYDPRSPKVTEHTIYDIASITKSIPTASLALRLIDRGRLQLTDKLITYVPEFLNSDREAVTIKHLLTYTVGGYALSALKDKASEELYRAIMTHDFTVRPGTAFLYANVPAFLLGLVVERVEGHTLDNMARMHFFDPLGMVKTTFFPQPFDREGIAPTEIDGWRGLVQGQVHDESAYVFTVKGQRAVGHAGLFSTAPDILNFLEMFLRAGVYKGKRYLSEGIIRTMSTNQIPELGFSTGLGWQLKDPHFMGMRAGPHTFGKTGFTGTSCLVDVERGVAFVILSNRTYPKRPKDDSAIYAFRADIADIIFESVS